MSRLRTSNGLFLIVALAAVGFLLVYVPPKVLEQYERIKVLGPPWIPNALVAGLLRPPTSWPPVVVTPGANATIV